MSSLPGLTRQSIGRRGSRSRSSDFVRRTSAWTTGSSPVVTKREPHAPSAALPAVPLPCKAKPCAGGCKKAAPLRGHQAKGTRTSMHRSALLNVMVKAACRAGRSLKRDLGEVENLQVSLKGPRNFVTAADRRAEAIAARGARQGAAGLRLSRRGRRRPRRRRQDAIAGSSIRSTAPPISCTASRISPSRSRSSANGAIVAGLTYNPANDELFVAERGKGAFLNDRRIRVAARQRLAEAVVACGLPHYGRGDLAPRAA